MPHLGTPSCSLRGPPHPHSLSSGPCTGAPVPLQRAPPCNYAPISIPEGPGFPGDLRPHGNSGDLTRCWAYTPGEVTGRCQGNGRRAGPERGVMGGEEVWSVLRQPPRGAGTAGRSGCRYPPARGPGMDSPGRGGAREAGHAHHKATPPESHTPGAPPSAPRSPRAPGCCLGASAAARAAGCRLRCCRWT